MDVGGLAVERTIIYDGAILGGSCAMLWIDDLLFAPCLSALVSESNFARHHGLYEFSARRLQSGPCLFVKHRRNSYKFTCIQAIERCIHKLFGGEI